MTSSCNCPIKKLRWRWKTGQTHLASITSVYKYLLSKQWFYNVFRPFLQIKSPNKHKRNIYLIESPSMLASPQTKTVKPPDKKPGISDRSSFLRRRSVKFQFVWQKLCYNIPLAGLLQKHQARIHTGFHRFTKIGQSFHKEVNFSWKNFPS